MNLSNILRFTGFGLLVGGLALVQPGLAQTSLPVNDNRSAPYLGVAKAGPVSPATDDFAAWLGRTTIIGEGTLGFNKGSDWNSLAEPKYAGWFYDPAQKWIEEGKGRVLVIAVPMLLGPPDRSGPTTGPDAGKPVSLADGAAGKYDKYFFALAQGLVAHKLGSSILRLGWEFNGDWYAWSVKTPADAANFAAYWKHIVNIMRTVPGQDFKFNWGGTVTYVGASPAYKLSDAFPEGSDAGGKPYVDQVGLDIYDSSWSNYPWPADATPELILAAQKKAWSETINTSVGYWGIPAWTAIAAKNHLPFTVPEWGVSTELHSGKDDTYYVTQMHDFIQNPDNHVFYAAYYDSESNQISPTGGYVTKLTRSAALYKQLFSIKR